MKNLSFSGLSQKVLLGFSLVLFASCDFSNILEPTYNDGAKDFFKEYTENAAIEEHTFTPQPYSDASGRACVSSSDGNLVLDYYMRNPQKYILEPSVTFNSLDESIDRGSVQIIQSETEHIVLTIPQSLLVESDEGKNISPTISLLEPKSGRQFRQYSLSLYCNSKPPRLFNPTVLNDGNTTFAVAFDMPEAAELALRHKDLAYISINGTKYEVKIDENGNFTFPDSHFTTVWRDSYSPIGAKKFTHTDRSVYFDTEEAFSANDKEYSLVLTDVAGLTQSNKASTVITKLKQPVILDSAKNEIESGTSVILEKNSDTNYTEITLTPPTQDHLGNDVENTTVHYVIYKGTSTVATLYETGSTNKNLTIQLEVGTWYIEAWAEKTNYENSAPAKADIRVIDTNLYISENGNDNTADGSEELPYASFSAAIAEINARSLSTSSYTFYITGNLSEEQEVTGTIQANSIVIKESEASAIIDSLKIGTNINITLTNITVNNLTLESGNELTLKDGANIKKATVSGPLNMEGSALVTEELKVNDTKGGIITITKELTQETAATITPETYANGTRMLSSNELLATNYGKFTIKQNTTDTVWGITSSGILAEIIRRQIGIIVYTGENDISVTKSESANSVTFTAQTGFTGYSWKIDGKTPADTGYSGITENGGTLVLDTSSWSKGIYDIYLTAEKDSENYSFHAQITVD